MLELALELSTAEFGDLRLTKRLGKIVEAIEKKPNMSIPAAANSRAEMEAAYRFCDNPKVSPRAIQQPHFYATQERLRQTRVAILVQDTTELDLTRPEQQVAGVGPLEYVNRWGLFHHPLMAFDDSGLSLGLVWQTTWARDALALNRTADEKQKARRAKPIEEKESRCWLEGFRAARDVAEACPETTCVLAADSAADIYEVLSEPRDTGPGRRLEFVIRAAHDRAVDDPAEYLWQAARTPPCVDRATVAVSSRRKKMKVNTRRRQCDRDSRLAEVEIRATQVSLLPPRRLPCTVQSFTINVVMAEEVSPPDGEVPIQWLLLTTLPIDTVEQIRDVLHYSTLRWQIEVYFRTLKSGCRVEERYFEHRSRLENSLAVYSIVAWRILYLCHLSRECPDLACEVIFTPSEWKSAYVIVKRRPPPEQPPTLNELIRMIASLGGYVIRKSTHPGTQTLWLGLQRLYDLAAAWDAFGPSSPHQNFFDH